MDSKKLVKILVKGRVKGRVLDADHRETIAVYVDPFDKTLRTFVLKTAYQRFPWLENVPENQMRMYWIDAESDQISIYLEDDMETCIAIGGNVPKIYIDLNTISALHVNIICDGCEGEVRGFRYKCMQCRNFDLCHACETKGIHSRHVMYRMPEPLSEQEIRFDRRMMKSL